MDTSDLLKVGHYILPKSFRGVYALNNLPKKISMKQCMFIVNTDPDNLPGKHWMAVIIRDGTGFCFDPLGFAPPALLGSWMTRHCHTWTCNLRHIQPYLTNICGHFCIHFLYFCSNNYLRTESYETIINLLYPVRQSPPMYETTVLEFKKIMYD